MRHQIVTASLALVLSATALASAAYASDREEDHREGGVSVQLGPRPFFLVNDMEDGEAEASAAALLGRPVQEERLLDRPSRRGAAVPGTHAGVLRSRCANGRRHPRVRRHLHQGQAAGLPARAERSAHDDQHPGDTAREDLHQAVHARGPRGRRQGRHTGDRRMPHERDHAGGVQDADRQDGRLQPGGPDAGGIPRRNAELPHRPTTPGRPADI